MTTFYSYNSNNSNMQGGWTSHNSDYIKKTPKPADAPATDAQPEKKPSAVIVDDHETTAPIAEAFADNGATVLQNVTPPAVEPAVEPVAELPAGPPELLEHLQNATITDQAPVALVDVSAGTVEPHAESPSFMARLAKNFFGGAKNALTSKTGSRLRLLATVNGALFAAVKGFAVGGWAGAALGGIAGGIAAQIQMGTAVGLVGGVGGLFTKNKTDVTQTAPEQPAAPQAASTFKPKTP